MEETLAYMVLNIQSAKFLSTIHHVFVQMQAINFEKIANNNNE